MKKSIRMLLCGATAALLLSTGVSAADREVSVEFNGQPLTFSEAAPQIVNDRTYLPFRAVFNALGFADDDITFQAEQRQVKAVKEDLEISMVIGENKLTVVEKGESRVIDTDVPAFIDANLGRTYVPARFVSEAAGCRVGWNGETGTVIIDDIESILAADQATYTKLEALMNYMERVQSVQPAMVKGDYLMSMTADGENLQMGGSYYTISDEKGAMETEMDMSLTGKMGGEDVAAMIPEPIKLELRGDMETNDFYFRSSNLQNTVDGDAWYHLKLEVPEEMKQLNQLDLAELKGSNGKESAHNLVRALADSNPDVGTWKLMEGVQMVLSDNALKPVKGGYASEVVMGEDRLVLALNGTEKKIDGYSLTIAVQSAGNEMLMIVGMDNNETSITMQMAENGKVFLQLDLKGAYAKSDRAPRTMPGAGEKVVELTSGQMPMP